MVETYFTGQPPWAAITFSITFTCHYCNFFRGQAVKFIYHPTFFMALFSVSG
jgi:hypothetical protein